MRRIYVLITIGTLAMAGCDGRSSRLKAVLEYSGKNRMELEKVLIHYSQDPKDSLKLKAAVFLIENMPGHYTYGGPFMEKYIARIDTIREMPYPAKKLIQMLPFGHPEFRDSLILQEDVKFIKADFLIHHIEKAFHQWQSCPWLKDTDFETFREYLLPYRVENEPLDYWRDSVQYLESTPEEYGRYYDDSRYSGYEMSNNLNFGMYGLKAKIPEKKLQDFNLDCISLSKLYLFVLRTIGIPCAIDIMPNFANHNARHYGVVAIDQQIKSQQSHQIKIHTAGKIFRRTFSHNKTAIRSGNEYIPPFFLDPFNKDVTNQYLQTTEVTLKIPRKVKAKHVYLAIFNSMTWKPIACEKSSGGKVTFPDMEKGVMYLPVYYDEEEEMHPLSSPFILRNNGNTQPQNIRKDSLQKLHIVRKYPYDNHFYYSVIGLINSRFEASNDRDFKNADTVYRITKIPTYRYERCQIDTTLKKRYWRFVPKEKTISHLTEFQFIETQGKEIKGKITGPDTTQAGALFDHDPLSMKSISQWIGMDFGKPVSLSKIGYLPRSDANGIYADNEYELFYYDFPEGWHSMGIKKATDDYIDYDGVPAGGLYWLRNLTTGKEERIFTWEKERARFW